MEAQRPIEHPEKENRRSIALTPFQASRAVLFEGYDHDSQTMTPFSSLNGFINDAERATLQALSTQLLSANEIITMQNGFKGLIDTAKQTGNTDAAKILRKLSRASSCTFVTAGHMNDPELFKSLSVPTQVVFAKAAEHGAPFRDLFDRNGVMVYFKLKQPSHEYRQAIEEDTHGMGVEAKMTVALSPDPPASIKKASHNFIHVNCISPSPEQEKKDAFLNIRLNKLIDDLIEPEYAGYVLRKDLLGKEMEAVFISIAGLLTTISIIHLTLNRNENDFALNAMVKAITPVLQDLVTYYSQIKPFLSGKTNREKWEKIKTYAGPAIVGVLSQSVGGVMAQHVAETSGPVLGSIVYGGIPFLHSVYTMLTTIHEFRRERGCSWKQAVREISRHNPAVESLLGSSFATFLTSIAVLGMGGQFNNGNAIAVIEGGEEHALTALFTYLQLVFGTSRQFDMWAKREIELQQRAIFSPSNGSPDSF